MKNQIMDNMKSEVLIITNKGGIYGTGHFHRAQFLQNHLQKMKVSSEIILGNNDSTRNYESHRVVILDSRDDEFPHQLINQKRDDHYFIALDNRGKGRSQCDIIWDTLPHTKMNEIELKNSLKNCILNPAIFQHKNKSGKSKIIRTTLEKIKADIDNLDLIQYPQNSDKNNDRLSEQEFHDKLLHSCKIATYYGQTFFEALYLGKEIYLYDVSEYHQQLSDWFTDHWNQQPELSQVFDGQGLHRLAVLIRSILSGVLYSRTG